MDITTRGTNKRPITSLQIEYGDEVDMNTLDVDGNGFVSIYGKNITVILAPKDAAAAGRLALALTMLEFEGDE